MTPARLPIGRRAGGNPQTPERTRMSMVIAANSSVTYVMLNPKTRIDR